MVSQTSWLIAARMMQILTNQLVIEQYMQRTYTEQLRLNRNSNNWLYSQVKLHLI